MSWKNNFEKGQELVLSTCGKNCEPNANVVISLGFYDDKLLIADAQMNTTIKNLLENNKICVFAKMEGLYYRINGDVEIFNSGKYYDICSENDKQYPAKNAILISVTEVFDLDKGKKVL
ncbi:MAG: pyridoxamine 5'-phosphate oxidase family protein [Candidatus Magasanikbacteria bacterium]|nr:pyridoxamine 5'-phosphate oxidase family protein [Candidatus Magasanikbacteria bacterium]